jgi:hypothetical protein
MRPDRSATRPDRLRRESEGEVESPLYPAGERIISRIACRFDAYEAGQDPAGQRHRPCVRLAERLLAAFSTDPDHQRHAGDATAHIAVNQEREAADHLLSTTSLRPDSSRRSTAASGSKAQASGASSRHPPRFFTTRCAIIPPGKPLPLASRRPHLPPRGLGAARFRVSLTPDLRIRKIPGVDSRILLAGAPLAVCSYGRAADLSGSAPA